MQDALKEYGVRVEAPFTVTKDQHLNGESKKQHVIEAEGSGHEHYEIKIISPLDANAAKALSESEAAGLSKLFAAAQTPYMGDIAQAIGGCPHQFGPLHRKVKVLGFEADALLGGANEKLGFGACSAALAKFKAAFITYYDPATKSLWAWRIYSPWTDPKSPLKSEWLNPLLDRFQK